MGKPANKLDQKLRLIERIKSMLLDSERLTGAIADELNKQAGDKVTTQYNIRRLIINDSPKLCQLNYIEAIKKVLNIDIDKKITEAYMINSPELINE